MTAALALTVAPPTERRRPGRPKAARPLKPFSVRFDDDLLEAICREATRQSVNPQLLIRVAMRRYLAQPEASRHLREAI